MKTTVLALALAALPALATADGLKPFNATYRATYMGMAANGRMTLANEGNTWRYTMAVTASVGSAKQSTTFDEAGGRLRPLSNQDSTNVLFKSNNKNATYDWPHHVATWNGNVKADRRGPVQLQTGDLDAMLLNLELVRDFQAGKPMNYRMVDNGKASDVSFTRAGEEAVNVGGKSVQATKLRSSSGDLVLWVANGYPVPVRIHKNGDNIDLVLQSLH